MLLLVEDYRREWEVCSLVFSLFSVALLTTDQKQSSREERICFSLHFETTVQLEKLGQELKQEGQEH